MTDQTTPEPLTDDELAAIRTHTRAYLPSTEDAPILVEAATDRRRLLDEVDRLRARVDQIEHRLQGTCPSCRHESLTINDRGWLTCHWSTCEHPDAAALLLTDPPAADDDGAHDYLSTGCLHGDMTLPDGRTGHQYCQGHTGNAGTKKPASCKFCQAPCECGCHQTDTEGPTR